MKRKTTAILLGITSILWASASLAEVEFYRVDTTPENSRGIDLACKPATIKREVPAAIKYFTVGLKNCKCFKSAEEASTYINEFAQGLLENPVMPGLTPSLTATIDLQMGWSSKVTLHCYSHDQLWQYHNEITGFSFKKR